MSLDQEKRVMLAFALSIVMLIVYRIYFMKEPPPEVKKTAPVAATTPASQPAAPPATATAAPKRPPAPVALPVLQGAKPEDIVVENKLYRVVFSTQGAVVKSWVLKSYRDAKDQLLDTVNGPACESLGFPMSLDLPNPALKTQVNQGIYVATANYGPPAPSGKEPEVHSGATLSPPVHPLL